MPTETFAACEIDLYHINSQAIVTHRFAERGFVTRATDTPANTHIPGRLIGPVQVERSIRSGPGGLYGSLIDLDFSSLELSNADGALDALVDDYASDGREVRIKVGTVSHHTAWQLQPVGAPVGENVSWAVDATLVDTFIIEAGGDELVFEAAGYEEAGEVSPFYDADEVEAYATFELAFRCLAGQWEATEDVLRLRLKDPGVELQGPMQLAAYAGTGGREGNANNKGVTKPMSIGECNYVPLYEVDAFRTIYALHSGPVASIFAVYDRGVPYDAVPTVASLSALQNAVMAPGTVLVCPSEGLVRFETVPTVPTAGVVGDASSPTSLPWSKSVGVVWPNDANVLSNQLVGTPSFIGSALKRLLVLYGRGPAFDGRIDAASFDDVNTGRTWFVGLFLEAGGTVACEDVVGGLALGAGLIVGPDRLLNYRAFVLDPPQNLAAVAAFTQADVLDIERLPLPYGAAPFKWRVGYNRTWRPHREDEIAAAAPDAQRERVSRDFRYAESEDETIWRRDKSSVAAPDIDSPYFDEVGAQEVLARMKLFYAPGRGLFRIRIATSVLGLDLGDVVTVTYPRFGLGAGRKLMVVRVRDSVGGDDTNCEFHGFG